jgi:signal transduction histidine kinase
VRGINRNRAATQEGTRGVAPTEGPESPADSARPAVGAGPPQPRWRILSRIRIRLLLSYVVLLALSTVVSLVAARQVLHLRLDEEISNQLLQEAAEFRSLVGGSDPSTGSPFGTDLKAIFDVFFDRNFPGEGELLLSLLDGRPYKWKRADDASFRLEQREDLFRQWSGLINPERGELETPIGTARYLAVPVVFEGRTRGAFIVANFPAHENEEIDGAIRLAIAVSGGVLVVALLLAWWLAGRVLGPLSLLTRTARSIKDSDLTHRIPVRGHDEVSELAATFNEMLDRLEAAFTSQKQFVDDAGHELRTPITIIRGHLELLEEEPQQRRETIALVTDELERMARIVNDLVILAKHQQPDFLDLKEVDLGGLTKEVYAKATALASRRWQLENVGDARIVADPQRVTQAMIQLAENAVNHTAEGDLIIFGSTVASEEARFWIRDTGPGIPRSEQERIFRRFARRRGGRRSDGAGLGLAIVRAIAEAHGGKVEVRSQPGAGAMFTVVIPATRPSR